MEQNCLNISHYKVERTTLANRPVQHHSAQPQSLTATTMDYGRVLPKHPVG